MPLWGNRAGAVRHFQAAHRLFIAFRVPRYIAQPEIVTKEFHISF